MGGLIIFQKLSIVSVCLLLWGVNLSFADENWQAQFVAPKNGDHTLRIDLPDNLDILALTTLAVELDTVDITALLKLEGVDFLYQPLAPLAAGDHVLRLINVEDPENPIEKAAWAFQISNSENTQNISQAGSGPSDVELAQAEQAMTSGSFRADTLTEFSYRFADKNTPDQPNHAILGGAGDLSGDVQSGNLRLSSRGNYLIQSDKDLSLTGNAVDLGEYELNLNYSGDAINAGATLGHHDIGQQSLLMNGFYRRGASVRAGDVNGRVQAQAFTFGTESLSGAENFTGLNDEAERVAGGTVSVQPFSDEPGALKVTGLFYDGKGAGSGDGIMTTEPVAEGSGWSAIIEKSFADQRVALRGEYAHSSYDQDGEVGTAPEKDSQAISLSVDARPFSEAPVWLGDVADISLGASYDRIGTYFQSIANNGIAADREAYTLLGNLNWGAVSTNLQYVYETNNVDELAAVATDQLQNLSFAVNYTMSPFEGGLDWLGTPNLYVSGFVADAGRVDTPSGYLGPDTNNMTRSVTLGGSTSYGNWSWGVSHSVSSYEDFTDLGNDTLNNGTALNINWTDFDRYSLGGGVQFNVFDDLDANTTNYGTNLYVDMSAELIKEILNLNLDYNLNLSAGNGDQPDTQLLNGEIEWTFLKPEPNNPGLALAVGGSMENSNGNAISSDDQTAYQVFFTFRVKAPFAYDY